MRTKLSTEEGKRKRFRALFERTGKKVSFKGYSEDTLLLTHIVDVETNAVVCDHIWFAYTKGFEAAKLSPGLTIEFEARVKEYAKGYVNTRYKINNRKLDYKLSNPTKITVVNKPS
jgi:hypothetical protein